MYRVPCEISIGCQSYYYHHHLMHPLIMPSSISLLIEPTSLIPSTSIVHVEKKASARSAFSQRKYFGRVSAHLLCSAGRFGGYSMYHTIAVDDFIPFAFTNLKYFRVAIIDLLFFVVLSRQSAIRPVEQPKQTQRSQKSKSGFQKILRVMSRLVIM